MNLSVCLITYNEEWIIGKTLESIKKIADEIVIVDSHSTDSTVEIAKHYGARIYTESFKGFGLQKNSALEKCTCKWVLFIDADEIVTPELAQSIKETVDNDADTDIFSIRFQSVCFGKHIKHGGWSNFYRIRLFKRDAGCYSSHAVHEVFLPREGKTSAFIKQDIYHYTYRSVEHFINKVNCYTTKKAQANFEKGKKARFTKLVLSPPLIFFKMYIFKLGILDGFHGLVLAKFSAFYAIIALFKQRNMELDETKKKRVKQHDKKEVPSAYYVG